MPQRVYISDSNIWIDFRFAGLLDVLFGLPFVCASTDFVLAELHDPSSTELLERGLVVEPLSESSVLQLFALMAEHNNSSLADVSCYLVAREQGYPLLTGDGRLRKKASKEGIEVHGALWLLDQLIAHEMITPLRAADGLRLMRANNARLPRDECEARLTMWLA